MALSQTAALAKDKRTALSVEMQHRHFSAIAHCIYTLASEGTMTREDRDAVAEHFAEKLDQTNPRFDRFRFLQACTLGD